MKDNDVKLTSAKSVKLFLDAVIKEGLKSALHQKALQEKEKQAAAGGSPQGGTDAPGSSDGGSTDLFGGSDTGGDEGEQEQPSKTADADQEKLEGGDITPKDIVEKLNSIRSGKSFKDDSVKGSMEQYIESLSTAERTALLAFLKGIAQIVTGEIPAQQAEEPTKHPADVQMQKGEQHKTKHIKPNVIKGAVPKPTPSGGQEDTSAPTSAPITAKKR